MIKDWLLLIIVAILVAIDMFICLMGTAFDQSRLTAMPVLSEKLRKNVSFQITINVVRCMFHIFQKSPFNCRKKA